MTNVYSPVSLREMLLSVAEIEVVMAARRESFGAEVQRVRQKRPPPDWEWLVRDTPGICSQHWAVLNARPAPTIDSSPPCSLICTAPPPAPCGAGLGPHASPQSVTDQLSVSALAVQAPLRVGLSSAQAAPGAKISATSAATKAARRLEEEIEP